MCCRRIKSRLDALCLGWSSDPDSCSVSDAGRHWALSRVFVTHLNVLESTESTEQVSAVHLVFKHHTVNADTVQVRTAHTTQDLCVCVCVCVCVNMLRLGVQIIDALHTLGTETITVTNVCICSLISVVYITSLRRLTSAGAEMWCVCVCVSIVN